jgi:hypothetical protein
MTPILVFSTAHKHSRTLFQKAQKKKKTDQNNKKNSNNSSCYRPQKRTRKHGSKEATRQGRGRGNAANTQAHEEQWWEPAQPARARPVIHGVTRRLGCWNRLKIHWLTRSLKLLHSPEDSLGDPVGRYSAAVSTRGFIGRTDPVVTLLQFQPDDSLGDPIRSLRLLQ